MMLSVAPILADGTAAADPWATGGIDDADHLTLPTRSRDASPNVNGAASGHGDGGHGPTHGSRDPRVIFLRRNQGSVLLPLVMGGQEQAATKMAELLGVQVGILRPFLRHV